MTSIVTEATRPQPAGHDSARRPLHRQSMCRILQVFRFAIICSIFQRMLRRR